MVMVKTNDAVEETNAVSKQGLLEGQCGINKSKDFPWKVKCQRLVDHVYAVFAYESEN